jgi:ribosomal protein S18 acetylase RimI-like enzyme
MIRRGDAIDVPFLRDMVHHAYYWRENDPLATDPVARYVVNFGRRGDAAVIAIEEHRRVGAAWYRLFSSEEPGFAFVDEQTPEATIAVVPSMRGRGIGSQLLSGLLDRGHRDGFASVSLSVEKDNPSIKLYERHGFEPVREEGDTLIMRAPLQAQPGR